MDAIEIPPYLLHLSRHEAVLCWVSPWPMASSVVLRSIQGEETFEEKVSTRYHKVTFGDLSPGRYYRYEVGDLYTGEFVTPSDDLEFTVAAIGHTHGSESLRHYPDELLVARLRDLQPDLVLHSGDITYFSTARDFREYFFTPFRDLLRRTPVYVSPSNHDSGILGVGGIDFGNFRNLFPHDYASGGGGYYSFEHKNAKFIALSYKSLGNVGTSEQYRWLGRELENSESHFNVVVLGAANMPKEELLGLFDFLSSYRVDLVLGGDGTGVRQETIKGVPFFFTGTSHARPHSFRLLEFRGYFFTAKRMDATGRMYPELDVINSKAELRVIRDLLVREEGRDRPVLSFLRSHPRPATSSVVFADLNVAAGGFDAVSLRVRCEGAGRGSIRLRWQTTSRKSSLQLQGVPVVAGEKHRYILKLPEVDPLTRSQYGLSEIELYAEFGSEDLSVVVEEMALVAVAPF